MTEIPNMRYAKASHVMYQSCFISDLLNTNNSKNQKRLMPMIPNISACKYQSFWRSEMSSFNNVNIKVCSVSIIQGTNVDKYQFYFDQ